MKQQYQKPKVYIVEMDSCMPLASSRLDVNTGSQGDSKEDFVREYRSWGNLWDTNDKRRNI